MGGILFILGCLLLIISSGMFLIPRIRRSKYISTDYNQTTLWLFGYGLVLVILTLISGAV